VTLDEYAVGGAPLLLFSRRFMAANPISADRVEPERPLSASVSIQPHVVDWRKADDLTQKWTLTPGADVTEHDRSTSSEARSS
jgi:hypothetical protein